MSNTFYFDFVDPLSYLMELELRAIEPRLPAPVERVGVELVVPPAPITATSDPRWVNRWAAASRLAASRLTAPPLVPWSRKAHELHALAREHGQPKADEIRLAIFESYFVRGEDIGRVDKLVAIAVAHGLDRTAVKAALDVDRHQDDVAAARQRALAAGIIDVPTLIVGGSATRGFHNREALLTLLST